MRKKGEYSMFLQLLAGAGSATAQTWQNKIVSAVDAILVPLLIIACSIGMIWAVVVGIKMMKADDQKARDENKAKLINIAISIVAIAVLIGLFYALKNWLGTSNVDGNTFNIFDSASVGSPLMNTVNLVKQCTRMIVFKC
jgi:hypothetical protein